MKEKKWKFSYLILGNWRRHIHLAIRRTSANKLVRSIDLEIAYPLGIASNLNIPSASLAQTRNLWECSLIEEFEAMTRVIFSSFRTPKTMNPTEKRPTTDFPKANRVSLQQVVNPDVSEQREFLALTMRLGSPFRNLIEEVIGTVENWKKFTSLPSSVRNHHSEACGNLRHTVEVAKTSLTIAELFGDMVNTNVLITGALLHDIGKLSCYRKGDRFPWQHTPDNQLLGHKVMSFGAAFAPVQQAQGLSESEKLGILHCLWASLSMSSDARNPACVEAEILIRSDQLSASIDMYRQDVLSLKGKSGDIYRSGKQRHILFLNEPKNESSGQISSRFPRLVSVRRGAR
jgi:putative nucleotidyltransferase with HDIG domain